MKIHTSFKGRIVQIAEALSYQDAVSNQVLELHRLLLGLGLRSEIYAKWHDPRLEDQRQPLEQMQLNESDIAILHFCGRSEHALRSVLSAYCTRVMVYHNVTPASFFPVGSRLNGFCVEGRQQLNDSVHHFHRLWADSQFNLDELFALGVPVSHGAVVPIVVNVPGSDSDIPARTPGTWLFVGRIAPNKAQVDLIRLFAEERRKAPEFAQGLILAGAFEENDPYYQELLRTIGESRLGNHVRLAGVVSDLEREQLYRTAMVYVSLSEHEGFGVPLVEAGAHGLPVVALGSSAVPETMGHSLGVVSQVRDMLPMIERIQTDTAFCASVVAQQFDNARRFEPASVAARLVQALQGVLPVAQPFRKVSVVICTYNRKAYLERVLEYLRYQMSPAFEVIIVDGPSDDGSKELLLNCAHEIKLAQNPERNLSKSRNLGIELADGDIVAFIDDDALPFDDWIAHILREYNARPLTTAGLGGPAYYAGTFWFQAEDNGINCLAEAQVNIDSRDIGQDGWFRYNTGTNATFTASSLRSHGGFDEQFDYYLDESEVCFRLQLGGWLVGYSPDIVVRHEFAQSHNRQGRLNYNWFTICKNTAYFVAAYSGLTDEKLNTYLETRMQKERINAFDQALAKGEITEVEHTTYRDSVRKGTAQGLQDASRYPQRRALAPAPGRFRPYPVHFDAPAPAPTGRLHVCIISREFPPFVAGGGVGTLYYHLASELLMMGHRVTVIVPGGELNIFKQGNICVHFTPQAVIEVAAADGGFSRNMAWSVSAMVRLAAIHEKDPVDIVDSALWDTEALATALLPTARRPKVVVRLVTPYALAAQINGWNPDEATSSLFMSAERALMAAADAVVPISESIAKSVEKVYGLARDARWRTIPCGIAYWPSFDVNQGYNEFPSLEKLPNAVLESTRIVLFVGRLERRKGVDLILEAANSILRSDSLAHIVLAGRDVEGWSTRSLPTELHGRVHFIGEVDNATREKLLARAWCLLFPSRYESFGLVPLEGFVHGVPAVAARAGAIPEVVEEGRSGLLFEAESAAGLAQCVTSLLTDTVLREHLSIGALKRVRELGSRQCAIRSVKLYRVLLQEAK